MTREELAAWLRLMLAPGIGPVTARKLLAAFGLPQQVLAQSSTALAQLLRADQITALQSTHEATEACIEATWAWLQAAAPGVMRKVVSLADADYPRLLLNLDDAPLLLYATGSAACYAQLASKSIASDIAIVGSRNATPQGAGNARAFAKTFAQAGLSVVSGLALGIDGAAHEGALDAQQDFGGVGTAVGSTVAVVGTGLDRVYPKRHHELAHRIVQQGLILSEFAIGTPPLQENFPRRNRIIAALTQGTLVVEANLQSGSLITARLALEQGKEVFAIPGSIHSPQSKGCHSLIKQGAKLVECAEDVLQELPVKPSAKPASAINSVAASAYSTGTTAQNDAEKQLFEALGHDPVSLDALIARTGTSAAQLQAQLLELELMGQVARLPGGLYQRQMSA